VELPLRPAPPGLPAPLAVQLPAPALRVLVAEDIAANRAVALALLRRLGHQAEAVEDGAAAVAALRDRTYDLVLMDIMMPVMDGYETIRSIRKMSRLAHLPIIAVTGKVVEGERQRCLDAGADDYVPKPVSSAQLMNVLQPWLPRSAESSS
jgi:CheY-like chemotaxis protein